MGTGCRIMTSFIKRLVQTKFWRQVATLSSGAIGAQVLSVLTLPILSRLYLPEAYGIFGIFVATVALMVVVVNGGFELAIMLPKSDEESDHLVMISLRLATGISLVLLLLLWLAGESLLTFLEIGEMWGWHLLIAGSLWLEGLAQPLTYALNRRQKYRSLALSRLLRAILTVGVSLWLGFLGGHFSGLIWGYLAGQMGYLIWLGVAHRQAGSFGTTHNQAHNAEAGSFGTTHSQARNAEAGSFGTTHSQARNAEVPHSKSKVDGGKAFETSQRRAGPKFGGRGGLWGSLRILKGFGSFTHVIQFFKGIREPFGVAHSKEQTLKEYADFPRFAMLSAWLNMASKQLPFFFLPRMYGTEVNGWFSKADKILNIPPAFIGMAIGRVFFQQAGYSWQHEPEKLPEITRQTFLRLLTLGLPFLIVVMIWGPELFAFVLGDVWYEAGVYARWLVPWLFLAFVVSPLSFLIDIRRKLKIFMYYNLALFVVRIVALWLGSMYFDAEGCMIVYGISGVVMLSVQLVYLLGLGRVIKLG